MTISSPNRFGLGTSADLNFVAGGPLLSGSVIFESNVDIEVSGSLQINGSLDLVEEIVGNIIPQAGSAYNPSIIAYPDSSDSSLRLTTELTGTATHLDMQGILGLTWDHSAGYAYGPNNAFDSGGGVGGGGSTFEFLQAASLSVWTVNHNLGFVPDVSVRSLGGVLVEGEIQHLSTNQLTITFDIPFAGYARCT